MPKFCVAIAEHRAEIFLLDAEEYRSIEHRLEYRSLEIYKFMHSRIWRVVIFISIVALHALAFLERPSSLSLSSQVTKTNERINVPPAALLTMEATLLLLILIDSIIQAYLIGFKKSIKTPWTAFNFVTMFLSWIEFFISIKFGSSYPNPVRRFFRPVIAMQKSQLMKKVLKSLSKTFVDILSTCFLLSLWLIGSTLLFVSIFSAFNEKNEFGQEYTSFYSVIFNMLVLLTTANHPDEMMNEYNNNRLSFILFFVFMVVGIFVFMNVLIAIVFNEFRGHVLDSMQTSILRRRTAFRAIFEVLRGDSRTYELTYSDEIEADLLRRVIQNSTIPLWHRKQMLLILNSFGDKSLTWENVKLILSVMDDPKESKRDLSIPIFENSTMKMCQKFILSQAFEVMGLLICLTNVLSIVLDISVKYRDRHEAVAYFDAINWIFEFYYILEQVVKFVSMGRKIYLSRNGCLFDGSITFIILVLKITEAFLVTNFGKEYRNWLGLSRLNLSRITNILVMLRAVRIILIIPSLTPIINTLFDIPWRLKSVIGILCLLFYLYALLGIVIFEGVITPDFLNSNNTSGGSYQKLNYGALNFNDFYSSIVVLWCLLIVNNWQVFMITFAEACDSKWIHLYMISWWLLAVIVVLNCVTAFVIEGYTQRKTYFEERRVKRLRPISINEGLGDTIRYLRRCVFLNDSFTFQMLFRNDITEPDDEELMSELRKCDFLCEICPYIRY